MKYPRVSILNTTVAAVTRPQAVDLILGWAAMRDRAYAVEAADTHVVTRARHESDFGAAMRKFDLICPDGMPLVWLINQQVETKLEERVSGAELMEACLTASAGNANLGGHFLLGGSDQLLVDLKSALAKKITQVNIAGAYSPPFGDWPADEFERICHQIKESNAAFVWVGLGCPKQEKWIAEHLEKLPPAVYFGIGAAFAFHAGHVKRAPHFLQKMGLEWFYRVLCEPRRLFKRYFKWNSLFICYLLKDRMQSRHS